MEIHSEHQLYFSVIPPLFASFYLDVAKKTTENTEGTENIELFNTLHIEDALQSCLPVSWPARIVAAGFFFFRRQDQQGQDLYILSR
jgi:hypothetical protein